MGLLNKIRADAASGSVPISDVLRSCITLSARLRDDDFTRWVQFELRGYPGDAPVPEYRLFCADNYSGYFYSAVRQEGEEGPLPPHTVRAFLHRGDAECLPVHGSVVDLERQLDGSSDESFRLIWPSYITDSFAATYPGVARGNVLVHAWHVWPRQAITRLLDDVRIEVLKMISDVEDDTYNTTDDKGNGSTNHFHGSIGNVAINSQGFSQHANMAPAYTQQNLNVDMAALVQDLVRLRKALHDQDLDPEHYDAIKEIRSAEVEAAKPEGERDHSKIIGALKKAGEWALTAANSIVATVAAEAIKQSLGMGSHP